MLSEEGIVVIASPFFPMAPKRKEENLSDRHVASVVMRGNPDHDALLRDIESHRQVQAVPCRQETRPVAVRLVEAIGTMNAMHTGVTISRTKKRSTRSGRRALL
jgi:hypothetical protein